MTLAALMLRDQVFSRAVSARLKYATLGVLFVNISIGGTLTNFAAPPVLMVAAKWEWSTAYLFTTLGWKAALAVLLNAAAVTWLFRRELAARALAAGARPGAPGARGRGAGPGVGRARSHGTGRVGVGA